MAMETNPTDRFTWRPGDLEFVRQQTATVRLVSCPHCGAGDDGAIGQPCEGAPAGNHFARWARARRLGLITADQLGQALDSISAITDGAMIWDGAA